MDLRSFVLCLAAFSLALTGLIYGVRFIGKRNYLMGVEWLILGISSSNFLFYFLSESQFSLHVAHFFDAFSRGFGIPIVTTLGLMILTHGYKPSILEDIGFFVGSFIATAILIGVDALGKFLPFFYLVMWILFSVYLAYFIKRLLQVGENLQAVLMSIALVSSLLIAVIYDFYKIPGEETNVVFNFFALALFTWSYLTVQAYYAYCALERSLQVTRPAFAVTA